MKRRTTTTRRTPAPRYSAAEPFNLFTGNIYELQDALKQIPETRKTEFLSFANQPSTQIAEERLLIGDAELFARYQAATEHVKVEGYNSKEFTLNNEGLFFDVSTYLTGQPEHWINEVETTAPGPAKDIKINISSPHWVTEHDIFAKLIKIVQLIDAAEASGQRLSIKAVMYAEDTDRGGQDFNYEIEIKKESETINIQQLVYLLANPILARYARRILQRTCGNPLLQYNPSSKLYKEGQLTEQTEFIYIPSITYDFINKICYTGGHQFNYETLNPAEQYNIKL